MTPETRDAERVFKGAVNATVGCLSFAAVAVVFLGALAAVLLILILFGRR